MPINVMATLLSRSVNVVTLEYISPAEEHSGAPTIVQNLASLEPLMTSIAKSDVLHRKKQLLYLASL